MKELLCPKCGENIIHDLVEKAGIDYKRWAKKYPSLSDWLLKQGFVYVENCDETLKKKEVEE